MSPPAPEGIGLLLEQNGTTSLAGVDSAFSGPLGSYARRVLDDLRSLDEGGEACSYDTLGTYAQCFNIGALIHYLLGDVERAEALSLCEIHLLRGMAAEMGHPEWSVQILQPIINIARLRRAVGDFTACVDILETLRRVVTDGQEATVLGFHLDAATARGWGRCDPQAGSVVGLCRRVEGLKCLAVTADTSTLRAALSRPAGELEGFELEHLLRCELRSGAYERVLQIVSETPACPAWAYLYVVDAFCGAGCLADARDVALALVDRVRDREESGREPLSYALALRLAWIGELAAADEVARHALEVVASRGSEVVQLRLATLLAVTAAASQARAEQESFLWELLQASRHNCERLSICATMARVGRSRDRYLRSARALSRVVSPRLVSVRPALLAMQTEAGGRGNRRPRHTVKDELDGPLPGHLPEAERLFHALTAAAERYCVQPRFPRAPSTS
jgi:hypothetical protein